MQFFINNLFFPQDIDLYEFIFFTQDISRPNTIILDISENIYDNIHNNEFLNSPINNEVTHSELMFESIRHRSLYEINPNKRVTAPSVLKKLTTIRYRYAKNRKEHPICTITQKKFNKKSKIIQLPCNHCFSSKAILQWLSSENCVCPVCKYEFEST
jgi:hypothetical protein